MAICFDTLNTIVEDARQSKVTSTTYRRILQQLDIAIEKYDMPEETIIFDSKQSNLKRREYLCSEIDELRSNHRLDASLPIAAGQRLVMLLNVLYQTLN